MIKTSFLGTVRVAVMVFFIIIGATAFSQILAFSGASRGLLESVLSLPLSPLFVLIAMQVLLLILGGFMEIATIMMITLPIFMPLVDSLGFNPIWGNISP
jgi:TRAP-type C4-dicarboxylate transport system permease large subunit